MDHIRVRSEIILFNSASKPMIGKLTVLVVLASAYFAYYRQPYAQGQKPSQAAAKTKSSVDKTLNYLAKISAVERSN